MALEAVGSNPIAHPIRKHLHSQVLFDYIRLSSGMILLPIAAGLCVKIAKRLRKQKKRADFEKPRSEVRIHSRSSYSHQRKGSREGENLPCGCPFFYFFKLCSFR